MTALPRMAQFVFCTCDKHVDAYFEDGSHVACYSKPTTRMRLQTWLKSGQINQLAYDTFMEYLDVSGMPEKAGMFKFTEECKSIRAAYAEATEAIAESFRVADNLPDDVTLATAAESSVTIDDPYQGERHSLH